MFGFGWIWIGIALVLIVLLVLFLGRRSPGLQQNAATPPPPLTPLEILERRYAAGDINTQEFEERKSHLTHTL